MGGDWGRGRGRGGTARGLGTGASARPSEVWVGLSEEAGMKRAARRGRG